MSGSEPNLAPPWLWALPLNGMLGLGGYWVARHGLRQPAGLPRGLAAVVLAWTWATVGLEVLGTVGRLAMAPLLAWSAAGLAIGVVLKMLDHRGAVDSAIKRGGETPEWEATVAVGLVLWAATLLGAQSLMLPVKVVSDGPIYHLYFAARWWKAGRLFLVAAPFGENAATYFPAVGDLWFTWLMVSWGGDRLAKIGQAPFLLVAALATAGIARRLGAGRSAAVIAASWFVSSVPLLLYSFEPNVDTIFVAGYLLAAYFLLRFALGDDGTGALALGAIAAGGALGTKATGVVFVPVLLALAVAAVLRRPGSMARKSFHCLLVLLLPMVMAGYWFGRNAILTGNPLYPLRVAAFGRVWLPGWYGSEAMRISQYYLPAGHWRAFGDILLAVLDPRLAPFWALALSGAWEVGRPRSPLRAWVRGCSALVLVNLALYWALIPYRTQQRFMLHALGLAAVPLAVTIEQSRWLRRGAVALLAVHLLTPQGWPFTARAGAIPWDLTPMIPNAIPALIRVPHTGGQWREAWARPEVFARTSATLALGLLAVAVAWQWSLPAIAATPRRIALALVSSLGLAAVAAVMVVPAGADSRRLFYPAFPEYVRGWLELDLRVGPSGTRIAYAGTDLPYYLLGAGLRNEVFYINVDAHRDWLLHDYHRAARARGAPTWPNPRPGWDRIHPDFAAWLANLRARDIQVLVVARANPVEGIHNLADAQGFPIERLWAEAHPELFEPLYGVAENDPELRIYRLRPESSRAPSGSARLDFFQSGSTDRGPGSH
jgi:hypothetical protein